MSTQWVVTGENTLQVEINEGPSGFDPRAQVEVELNYYEYDPKAVIGKSEHDTIARVEWAPPAPPVDKPDKGAEDGAPKNPLAPELLDAPAPTYDFPEYLFGAGTIEEPQPEWSWTRGETITPDPDTILTAVEKINGLIAAHPREGCRSVRRQSWSGFRRY